jgi:hypothetical protein
MDGPELGAWLGLWLGRFDGELVGSTDGFGFGTLLEWKERKLLGSLLG